METDNGVFLDRNVLSINPYLRTAESLVISTPFKITEMAEKPYRFIIFALQNSNHNQVFDKLY